MVNSIFFKTLHVSLGRTSTLSILLADYWKVHLLPRWGGEGGNEPWSAFFKSKKDRREILQDGWGRLGFSHYPESSRDKLAQYDRFPFSLRMVWIFLIHPATFSHLLELLVPHKPSNLTEIPFCLLPRGGIKEKINKPSSRELISLKCSKHENWQISFLLETKQKVDCCLKI